MAATVIWPEHDVSSVYELERLIALLGDGKVTKLLKFLTNWSGIEEKSEEILNAPKNCIRQEVVDTIELTMGNMNKNFIYVTPREALVALLATVRYETSAKTFRDLSSVITYLASIQGDPHSSGKVKRLQDKLQRLDIAPATMIEDHDGSDYIPEGGIVSMNLEHVRSEGELTSEEQHKESLRNLDKEDQFISQGKGKPFWEIHLDMVNCAQDLIMSSTKTSKRLSMQLLPNQKEMTSEIGMMFWISTTH